MPSNARVIKALKLSISMRSFNINYKPAKIYSNSKELEIENKKLLKIDSSTIVLPAIVAIAKDDENTLAPANIYSTHIIFDNDFNSLYLLYIASEKTCIVI